MNKPATFTYALDCQRCETCHFWVDHTQQEGWGECRFNSPRVRRKGFAQAFWPVTRSNDWCGQWHPAEDRL